MYVCICVCMYICIYVCMYVDTTLTEEQQRFEKSFVKGQVMQYLNVLKYFYLLICMYVCACVL